MTASKLKSMRMVNCLSQEELSVLSNISIKTIQRIENGKSKGSSYTIKQLAKALDIEPNQLLDITNPKPLDNQKGKYLIKVINLSALLVLLVPFTNLLIPIFLFYKNKHIPLVAQIGKKLISVQILWTFFSIFIMLLVPLIFQSLVNSSYGGGVPLFIPAYCFALFINVLVILTIAYLFSNKNENEIWLPNLL